MRSRGQTLPKREILEIGKQMITVINDIHKVGVVSADVKPDNILFSLDNDRYYLIDFGISCMVSSPDPDLKPTLS